MKKNNLSYRPGSGFKVPENYFQDLEDQVMGKIAVSENLDETYKGSSGFAVPQNYFENIEKNVLQKVGNRSADDKVISIFRAKKLHYAVAVAAVFTAIVTTVLFNPVTPEFTIDSVELSAIEHYIDEGYLDLNYNEISAYITEEGHSMDNFNTSNLSDEEVLDYLSENIEDTNIIFD